mgnify:CR=1 FL=1
MKYAHREQVCTLNIHYANFSLDYFLDCQQKLGIQNVELLAGHQGLWLDHKGFEPTAPIRRRLEERGIHAAVITPENCSFAYQFAPREKDQFERSFAYFSNGLRMGAELGSTLMEANPGWGYADESFEEVTKRATEMFCRLCEVAEEYGITIACETLRPQESKTGDMAWKLKVLFDRVNHPRFKVMIDTCAMGVAGETIDDWFSLFGHENIVHTHFIDGNPYGHLVWGDGHHSLPQFLKALQRNGYAGLLSQELTDAPYYANPFFYDQRNIKNLLRYMA